MGSLTLQGATSGQITVSPTAVAGINTITVAVQTGTLNVAGPAFSAYASATQTITLNSATKVQLDTEDFDTNNNFDPVTNYRFTPTVAGYYQLNGAVRGLAATTFTGMSAYIYKNGSSFKRYTSIPASANSNAVLYFSDLIYLNGSTDYIELWGLVQGTGTATFNSTGTSGGPNSYLSASLARGA